jgi:ribosomal protein L11 methyltransferase
MFAVTFRAGAEEVDLLIAELQDLHTAGVREGAGELTAYFEKEEDARRCLDRFVGRNPLLAEEVTPDYTPNWQQDWQPLAVGERFYLAPPWNHSSTPEGRILLTMRPGYVFGSGDHPTTQLCLELLESAVTAGDRVLDVGTGTGILAIAAVQLNAGFVAACDTSNEAIHAVSGEEGISLWHGTTSACRASAFSVALANLPTGVLIDLIPEIQRVLVRRGRLVASGFFEEQLDEVRTALDGHGFDVVAVRERGEWAALSAVKRP